MENIIEQGFAYWPMVLNGCKALAVLIIGWMVAGMVSSAIRKRINATPEIDATLGNFVASMVRWVLIAVVLIAVLGIFGIEATSLVAMMGAATLAIGLALQGTLSDLAAGFMLVLFRPYKIGQYVDIGGTAGTVVDLNLFVTELATPDNVQIMITNFSHHKTRRVDLVFGIDYGDSADAAKAIILQQAAADSRIKQDPEPWVRVTNLGDSSVDLTTRIWVDAADYWEVKFAMTQAVKEAFDTKGISIPYPHTVEIKRDA